MRRCQLALRLGVMFFPSARLPEPGTPCEIDCNVRGEGLVLRARGLVAGASAIEEEGLQRQGMWIRIVELPFIEANLETWLEGIGASSLRALEPILPMVPERPSPSRGQPQPSVALPRPSALPPARPQRLPEPSKDEDFGWLSGNIRPDS